MFFLLRVVFWLSIVLLLLPIGSDQHGTAANDVTASDAVSAASATVQDLRGFCGRQPEACSVGSGLAVAVGYRAQAGAKMLYEFLTQALTSRQAGSSPPAAETSRGAAVGTGGTALVRTSSERPSQNTLAPADLAEPWHGPQSRKEPKPAA
jgi:hypothetical protein